jgi:hypothetical protein
VVHRRRRPPHAGRRDPPDLRPAVTPARRQARRTIAREVARWICTSGS